MDHVAASYNITEKDVLVISVQLRNGTHYRYPSYGTVSEKKNMNQSVMGFCQSWSHSLSLCIAQDLQAKINPAYVKSHSPTRIIRLKLIDLAQNIKASIREKIFTI